MSTQYIGSKITVVSNMGVRYEGILNAIDTVASTVELTNVVSFGTEGRGTTQIQGSNTVYPNVVFRGSDIKDFGVIQFDGSQKYFVLDGQHRLTSLRYLFGQLPELSEKKRPLPVPPGLPMDELSVLLISSEGLPETKKGEEEFRRRLRRIFTVINRHAKATTLVENISMDEDDVAAIHTRKLLNTIELFKWSGNKEDTSLTRRRYWARGGGTGVSCYGCGSRAGRLCHRGDGGAGRWRCH